MWNIKGILKHVLCIVLILGLIPYAAGDNNKDTRREQLTDPDHYELQLPPIQSLSEWKERKEHLREKLLLHAGLWPMPEKTPLQARIFDERRGEGFTVAKVYYESLPGFFATGNLYRPTEGKGPFPAVICPHGHWKYGRLQNSDACSIPGRCIDFARQGFIVFSVDMVGYNDSFQLPHVPWMSPARLKADVPQPYENRIFSPDFYFPEAELYGFTLGGLQLWNNIRGVDFLTSLPDVDASRIGVTGASGGATQTIFLMVADERIKVAAPVNIIGARKHPGCRCENMPGMWIDASTVELSAAFAPKPLLLMSATEDPWTNSTPEREYPFIKRYYSLYNAEDKIKNVHVTGGHNYNAETRAAVYEWFCKHLNSPVSPIKNPQPISEEVKNLGDLHVFPDMILPENALKSGAIIDNWKKASEKSFNDRLPHSPGELRKFAADYGNMLAKALNLDIPFQEDIEYTVTKTEKKGSVTYETAFISRKGKGDYFEIESVFTDRNPSGNILVVVPEERGGLFLPESGTLKSWVGKLASERYRVYRVRGYASGQLFIPQKEWDSFSWPRTYNRDNRLNGMQDILTALEYVKYSSPQITLKVVGLGKCGFLTAFACAVSGCADKVVVDLNRTDPGYDGELVDLLPVGSIKRVGDFRTAIILLMQKPVTVFNPGPTFSADWYNKQAESLSLIDNLDVNLPDTKFDLINIIR